MNEERMTWLWQTEHTCIYDNDILQQITKSWSLMLTVKFRKDESKITTRNQGNPERNHKILNIVSTERYIWSICRSSWNVVSHKWRVHNGKLISPLLQQSFVYCQPWLSICRFRSRYEEDLPVSMAPMLNFEWNVSHK